MRIIVTALCIFGLLGCMQHSDGPAVAAKEYLEATITRDSETLYSLLPKDAQSKMESLHTSLTQLRALISKHYPGKSAEKALNATGADILDIANTPARLFDSLVLRSSAPLEVTSSQRWSTNIRSVKQNDNTAHVTSWGGDTLKLVYENDQWRVTLTDDDAARLTTLIAQAKSHRLELNKMIDLNNKHRYGVKK